MKEIKLYSNDDFLIKEVSLEEALKVFDKLKEWNRPEVGNVEYCKKELRILKV